ncbi:hypothetical protein M3175_07925 [Robertmurraya korlensis]|uniref:hypothetical protein n=1 Tax=Robertmurraya korlensis TaxID=519977 RepID=UPI00203EFE88|nr:hypothetical protein [Robertmurraya korlensis]MCM3600655.1 hypothetical protein [Robertmurraya korlensis]
MSKNPLLQKKYEEGKKIGIQIGSKFGFEQGKYSACMHFADKLEDLGKVPGIGPKTIEKILNHLGAEYRVER